MDEAMLERYRGRVVGINAAGQVVADAAELDELLDKLDARGIVGVTVQRIPARDEPLFIGLR
jgi:hypothetical protein